MKLLLTSACLPLPWTQTIDAERGVTGEVDADVWIVRSCGTYRMIIKRLCNPEHCRTNAFLQSGVGTASNAIYPINEVNEHVSAFVRNVEIGRGVSGCLFLLTVDEPHSGEPLFTLSLRPGTDGYLASHVNATLTTPTGGLLSFAEESSLPQWVLPALGVSRDIVPCSCLNPFYQRADFDGDGRTDYAVLVKETISGKRGIAIVHRGSQSVHVLGAGKAIGNGGDDFDWMDAWRVFDRGPVHQGVDEATSPTLRGDALEVEKTESASAILWWDGERYQWYQQGD